MSSKLSFVWIFLQLLNLLPFNSGSLEIKNVIRVASDLSPRFLVKLAENGRYRRYKGFIKDFSEELVNILGYQYEIVLAHDHPTSGQIRMNTSSGYGDDIFGMLLRNEADLAFGETEVTMERAQNFDFSSPVLSTRFAILYKNNNETASISSSHWAILSPFPLEVWLPFLVVSVLYFGFLKFHRPRPTPSRFKTIQKLKYSKKFAQIVLFTWVVFLFTSYVSNYTAQKVLQATTMKGTRPETLVDLVSQRDVKIGWLARGPVERFFRNTVNELYQNIYIQNIGRDWVSSLNEGVNKIRNENGKFAFITDTFAADHETQLDCTLYKLPQEFGPLRPIAVATSIGSPLRERINQAVLSLLEQGVIEALRARWFSSAKNDFCSTKQSQHMQAITTQGSLQETSPIFIIAVVGLFLATIIGLVEIQFLKKRTVVLHPKPPRQHAELLPKLNLETV